MTPNVPGDDPRWDRLIQLVAGELPDAEAAALQRWVEADDERRVALARLQEIWRATAPRPGSATSVEAWDAEAELRRIRMETRDVGGVGLGTGVGTGTGADDRRPAAGDEPGRVIARVGPAVDSPGWPSVERMPGRRSRPGTAVRAAAALMLLAGGGLLWQHQLRTRTAASAPTAAAMAEYRTAPGERLSLRLPDGTRVMLAPGGVLRRPSTYGVRDRIVHLEGEGYFIVTHDSTRPFAVHTARAIARDLGTRFVVRAYQDEAATDVVVAEGKVAVQSDSQALLSAGEHASVDSTGRLSVRRLVDLTPYLAWTEGQLVFERTPLHEVVRQLERWYGIDVRIADPVLRGRRLTATLSEENSAQAVDLVATSLQLRVSRSGTTYLLSRTRPRP